MPPLLAPLREVGSENMLGGTGQKGVLSVIYGAIIVAILAVFVIQFRPNSGQKTASLSRVCYAEIRGVCIDAKDFGAALGLVVPRGIDEPQMKRLDLRRHILNGLVERTLLDQDAERLGLSVSDEEVNADLVKGRARLSLPVDQAETLGYRLGIGEDMVRLLPVTNPKDKSFDYKVYQRVVRTTTNRSPTEFKAMQRKEVIANRMRDLVRARVEVSEDLAFSTFVRERSTVSLDYVRLKRPYFVARYVDTSPQAVDAWAKDHKQDIDKSWESRKAEFPAGCRKARHVLVKLRTDTQPQGHDREEAQKLMDKVLSRLRAGEDFSDVAKDLSEDPGSAARGGDLGCFTKGKMVKPFEDAAFALKAPGDLSDIVESPYGFHLIKLDAVVSEDPQKAEANGRSLVASELMTAMQGEVMVADAAKRVRELVQSGKTLAQAVDEVLAYFASTHKLTKQGQKTSKDAQAQGDDLRPKPESTEPFTIDRPGIQDVARGEKLGQIAFSLEKPGQVANDLVRLEDGYAVIQLKDRKAASREDFEKEHDAFMERLVNAKQRDMLQDYVARLREQAKAEVKINEAALVQAKRGDVEEE